MKMRLSNRRVAPRYCRKAPWRVPVWGSAIPEQRAECENPSEKEIHFATDPLPRAGTTIEILFKLPEKITNEPTAKRVCTGHVVPGNSSCGKFGAGVQFNCYQILERRRSHDLRGSKWPHRFVH